MPKKLIPEIALEIFASKFFCNYLQLLFIIDIIYIHKSTKTYSYDWKIILNYWFIYKIINMKHNVNLEMPLGFW